MQIPPSKVIKFLEKRVKPFFKIGISKRSKFNKDEIFKIFVHMSIQNSYAEGICNYRKLLSDTPSSDTFLRCIKNTKTDDTKNEFSFFNKKAIKIGKRKSLFLTPVPIAIDWVDLMFYGDKETEMVIGTQHKKGSNYAYRYMSASVLIDDGRFVIAVKPCTSVGKKVLPEIIFDLLQEIQKEIKISHVIFDRGFYNLFLIDILKKKKIKFMIHMPKNKKIERLKEENKFPFVTEYKSDRYKKNKKEKYPKVEFDLVGIEWEDKEWYFATNMKFDKTNIYTTIEIFRKRWGIETGYRMINQFLPKTTSKNYSVRAFYFYFACMMYNAWILFNLIKNKISRLLHIPVLFFKNLILALFLSPKTIS